MCAIGDQRVWFLPELQPGIIWCDLFLLVIQAHLKQMCNTAKLTGITHEYLAFGFLYCIPYNIGADHICCGGVGRAKVNKNPDSSQNKISHQILIIAYLSFHLGKSGRPEMRAVQYKHNLVQ